MDLLGRKRELRQQAEDVVVAAGCVEEWLRTSQDTDTDTDSDAGETARRWREAGRLDPDAAKSFATWWRERVRIAPRAATTGLVASQEDGSKEGFERSGAGATAGIEEYNSFTRGLKAEGYA